MAETIVESHCLANASWRRGYGLVEDGLKEVVKTDAELKRIRNEVWLFTTGVSQTAPRGQDAN